MIDQNEKPPHGPGRPKGLGKVPGSGRKKGTPNRHTTKMREYIAKHSGDITFLCQVAAGRRFYAADPENPNKRIYLYPTGDQRLQAAQILARKHVPDMKAVEMTSEGGEPFVFQFIAAPSAGNA